MELACDFPQPLSCLPGHPSLLPPRGPSSACYTGFPHTTHLKCRPAQIHQHTNKHQLEDASSGVSKVKGQSCKSPALPVCIHIMSSKNARKRGTGHMRSLRRKVFPCNFHELESWHREGERDRHCHHSTLPKRKHMSWDRCNERKGQALQRSGKEHR